MLIVATAARERATVDFRGLGPALRAHAQARSLTVSDVARLAVANLLKESASDSPRVKTPSDESARGRVKLTLRLGRSAANQLAKRARECALSQSAYLVTLIDEAPAPPLGVTTALGASTEQLAVVASDLHELLRAIGRGPSPDVSTRESIQPLLEQIHRHVAVASRLVAELRPARRVVSCSSAPTDSDG
jgi:hypothetical protein